MKRPEQILHRSVVGYMRMALKRGAVMWHTPNGGGRSRTEAAIMAGLGTLPGIPDLFVLYDGCLFAMELKAEKGRLTAHQETVLWQLEGAGAKVAVVRSLDEAVQQLDTWGLTKASIVV